ncbi:voltage-gated purine nucleotide uniporter SLC17A9-like isoform X2 [Ptychodera flava]|uniref:voltage-gated purine nucleotide uniporter SLC17A9-like isoform X2 n=2 Tax=Ptychodera flava TaxID=63121 RepID=UPI00396A4406
MKIAGMTENTESDEDSEESVAPNTPILGDIESIDTGHNDRSDYWSRNQTIVWGTALFSLTGLTYSCRNCMSISAVAMANEFHWDKSETGLVLSSFYWGYMATQILSGFLSDRIGGDQVITLATMFWGPMTIIYPFCAYAFTDKSSHLTFLVINRVIFGAVAAFHFPALSSICASKTVTGRRSFLFSALDSGATVGTVLSGSLGSYLMDYYGWQMSFYVFGAVSTIWAIAMRIFLMRKRCLHPCENRIRNYAHVETEEGPVKKSNMEIWKLLLRNKCFWAMIFTCTADSYTLFLALSWLPTFFGERFPEAKGWVYNVLPWTLRLFTGFGSGWIADRLISSGCSRTATRKFMQSIGALPYAMTFFCLGLTDCYVKALVLVTYGLTMVSLATAGAYTNTQDLVPAHAGAVYGHLSLLVPLIPTRGSSPFLGCQHFSVNVFQRQRAESTTSCRGLYEYSLVLEVVGSPTDS